MSAADAEKASLERALAVLFPEAHINESALPSHAPSSPDYRADIHLEDRELHLWIDVLRQVSGARLADAAKRGQESNRPALGAIPVLAAAYLSPSKQQQLREAHSAFLDWAGNAWLMAPGVHVDRRGFGNPLHERRESRDMFSDKASLVIRILFDADEPVGIRQIAEIAQDHAIDLSPGYVSKVVQELERMSYAARRNDRVVLRHIRELLDDWLSAYRRRKRPAQVSYFLSARSAEAAIPLVGQAFEAAQVDYLLSGHAGASLVDRHADFDAVDVYVRDLAGAEEALGAAGARPVERGGNVNVSVPYYRASAFYDAQERSGLKVASDLQLYLDLWDYPVRGREQAEHLYGKHLRSRVERGDDL